MERIRPKADPALGWAYRADSDTRSALQRGTKKLKDAEFVEGVDKPHYGGNLAEALAEAQAAEVKRRLGKRRRRKKMARRVTTVKEIHARKGGKAAVASKKKTKADAPSGKLIPLKTICADMDLDPKATRVKLRRLIAKGDIDWHDPNARWEFTPARAKQIKEHLNG